MRILYLDIDSLRPDHLGCYGYHRETSPNIDRIAKDGVRFENYYTSDAPCAPSRTALLSGRFGIHSGLIGHGGTAGDYRHEGAERTFNDSLGRESLPAFLRKQGFNTTLISTFAERHSVWQFYAGFNEMHNIGRGGAESAEEVTPTVLKWIEDNAAKDNWYLHVNYWDPHTPYRVPSEAGNRFANDPLPAWLTEDVFEEHMRKQGQHSLSDMNSLARTHYYKHPRHGKTMEKHDDLRVILDNYDEAIHYVDGHIGRLFKSFEEQGVLDDMVIIISSDHGESMGELGIYSEHGTADQATNRIPMIIRWPSKPSGSVDDGLHYQLDLAPTLAEMLGAEAPSSWDGVSYAGTIESGMQIGRPYLVLSQCAHVCQRSVRFDDWLYMRSYHDGHHGFPKEMLFNLKDDPHEQFNLAEDRQDICRQAVYFFQDWHDEMMSSMPFDTDPLWTVMKEGGPFHAKEYAPR
ncbi:sulfatase-like hydrolase/transferase [Paenibacillus sp. LMG 31460]|uniref:Sulfatase-like hydrolase/transferase n=1 Tax=Paenibacillus germinis TaxID=2654979 RepID=A0ABX1Z517_9BACL|nr:sulfatase [Paenibacillus germinis]NOU88323.1 sulfatase-like hydrolase/transferase [Paenibacillus germinis]